MHGQEIKVIPKVILLCYSPNMAQTIGPKGQVVVPKKIRDALGLKPGDSVVVHQHGNQVIIESTASQKALKGIFAGLNLLQDLEEEKRIERMR